MTELTLLLVAAALGFGLSRVLDVPPVPVLIVMGLTASALAPVETAFLQDTLVLGVAVLVFVAGIELNPARVRGQKRTALQVGLLQFALLAGLGVGAARLFGLGLEAALYLGLALTASSTLVVVRILQKRQLMFEPLGRLVTGVLLLQDLLVILLIPVITRLPDGGTSVLLGILGTGVLVGVAWITLKWISPLLIERVSFDEESLLLLTLSVLFVFLALAQLLGLPTISAAFLAGVALSAFPVNSLVRGQVSSLSDFFNALFFTALGAFIPVPTLTQLGQGLILAAIVVVLTPPMVAFIAERAGLSARPALAAGLLLAQTSEFSLLVGLQGVALGQLPTELFTVIVLVTVFTMVLTPVIATDEVAHFLLRFHPVRRRRRMDRDTPRDHVLLAGCGRNGMALLEFLMVRPCRVVVIDDDPATITRIAEAGVEAIRGDIADVDVLRRAGAGQARAVVSTIRQVRDNQALIAIARDNPILVRTFAEADAEWVRDRGGVPIRYSAAAAEEFTDWFESWEGAKLSPAPSRDRPVQASEDPSNAGPPDRQIEPRS